MSVRKPMITTMQREKFSKLYTPPHVVTPLLPFLPPQSAIWECTDYGSSNITKILREAGHWVTGSDIETGIDFLTMSPPADFDLIVTNPPYDWKDDFIARCYEYDKPFALLLPIASLQGIGRGKMFRKNGLSVIVLDARVDFTGGGAPWFAVGWFCWRLPALGDNRIAFLKLGKDWTRNEGD